MRSTSGPWLARLIGLLSLTGIAGCGLLVPDPTSEATDELWLQVENKRREAVTVQVMTGHPDRRVVALTIDVDANAVFSDQLARVGPWWVIRVDDVDVYSSIQAPEGETARKILVLDVGNDVRVDEQFWITCQNVPENPFCEWPP